MSQIIMSTDDRNSNSDTVSASPKSPRSVTFLKKDSSFKYMRQFSITFCQKGSRDLKTWLNGFSVTNSSPLQAAHNYYKQVQTMLPYTFIILALLILLMEMLWCLSLIGGIFFEPGIVFLFTTFIAVSSINFRIMSNMSMAPYISVQDKSKEI